jgi:hypothetical protein
MFMGEAISNKIRIVKEIAVLQQKPEASQLRDSYKTL